MFIGSLFRVSDEVILVEQKRLTVLSSRDCGVTKTTALCTDDKLANQLWKVSCEAVDL